MDQSHGHKTNYYDYIFKNSIKSDVTLIVKDKIIRAHKLVLGPQNPVFMEQFMSQPGLTKYEISDVDSTAFQIFIEYLYTGNIFDENVNEDLLLVAHKYANPTIINICRDKLRQTINSGDIIKKLLIFIECEETFIEETSILVAKNFNDFKTRPNFQLVFENKKALDAILKVFDKDVVVLTQDQNPNQTSLIDSALRSDLTIKVQDVQFLVHKEILSRRNAILKTIVSSLTTASNLCPSIDVPDLGPESFKSFLKYIYTGDINEKYISKELMRVAHIYKDKKLMRICEDNLLSSICVDNVAELLILATKVESKKMKETTSKFIADRYAEMKQRVDFQQVKLNPEAFEAVFNQFAAKINGTNAFKGTISIKVPEIEGRTSSEQFYLGNIPWNMAVTLKKNKTAYLGIFLYCVDKNVPFEHKVNYSFKLVSSVDKSHDIVQGPSTQTFTSNKDNWGVSNFVRLDDFTNKEKGLVINGTVKVQVQVKFVD